MEAHLCEYQEGAVHRSGCWCSVDLFRVSRRRVARTPPGRIYPDICVQITGWRAGVSGYYPDAAFLDR